MIRLLFLVFIIFDFYAETKVFVLGSGTPNPDPVRGGSSYLIMVDKTPYLIDFGVGVVRNFAGLTKEWGGELEIDTTSIEHAFLTHMHSDHTLGLSDLIITPWIMGKTQTLKLHGPKELNLMAQNIIDAYAFDIDYRINGTQPQNSSGYKYDFFEIHDGYIFENDDMKLEAFKNSHGDLEKSFGFVVTTADLKIVFSGDTAPSNKLLNKSKDADILVHEVFSEAGFLKKTPDWQIYHAAHHTSPKQLGSIAKKIKPKKLVLSHILYWGSSEDDIKNEVAKYYDGEILVASDLMQIY